MHSAMVGASNNCLCFHVHDCVEALSARMAEDLPFFALHLGHPSLLETQSKRDAPTLMPSVDSLSQHLNLRFYHQIICKVTWRTCQKPLRRSTDAGPVWFGHAAQTHAPHTHGRGVTRPVLTGPRDKFVGNHSKPGAGFPHGFSSQQNCAQQNLLEF